MICTRKEFTELAKCSVANLSTYIKRGQVFLESDGKTIDTNRRENSDFLKRRASMGKTNSIPIANTVVKEVEFPAQPQIKASPKLRKAAEATIITKYELELEKMQAEIDSKHIGYKLSEQKLSTLLGNNIPIDVVKTIIAQLSKSIINNYKSFSEQQITEICHKFRIEDVERVKLLTKNTNGLNAIHQKAVTDARFQTKKEIGSNKLNESESNDENE